MFVLLVLTNLFSPNEYENNKNTKIFSTIKKDEKIVLRYF